MRWQAGNRAGFTLIELLVVMVIIALAATILFPAIQYVRETARQTVCLNNLHQFGIAMCQYTDIHGGHFPWTYHAGDTLSWVDTLAPFVENVDEMRLCPDDPMGEARVQPDAAGIMGTSYVINEYIAYQTSDGYSVLNINQIQDADKLIVLFEGSWTGREATDDHVHTSTWYAPVDVYRNQYWNVILAEVNPTVHNDCANYLFADGHADKISIDLFSSWVAQDANSVLVNPNSATNFARPNQRVLTFYESN
ncbi:MAG TPA: type II secretion system protein [Pirellulales bacterium]|nr:type II secretion system protein [Pirellulales bacterium]